MTSDLSPVTPPERRQGSGEIERAEEHLKVLEGNRDDTFLASPYRRLAGESAQVISDLKTALERERRIHEVTAGALEINAGELSSAQATIASLREELERAEDTLRHIAAEDKGPHQDPQEVISMWMGWASGALSENEARRILADQKEPNR